MAEEIRAVSIPIGFSGSLQRRPIQSTDSHTVMFQSLSGFQVRCNPMTAGLAPLITGMFQSLSGFQVRCNGEERTCQAYGGLFQSLSGFQVRCNIDYFKPAISVLSKVSIPIGFSGSLQRKHLENFCHGPQEFQSLSGFQVRCNQSRLTLFPQA